jgi:hypothetical protein
VPRAGRQDQVVETISLALADYFICFLIDSGHWIADELDAGVFEVFSKVHRDVIEVEILEDHPWKRSAKGCARLIR